MEKGSLLARAVAYAAEEHVGQFRKGTQLPYIVHPMEVAAICGTMTEDEEVLAAAVLHDTIEDTPATKEDLEDRFGPRVTELVLSQSENKREGQPATATWKVRKEESIEHIRSTDDVQAKMLCLSDKLSNIRSVYRDLERDGDPFWNKFHQNDPIEQSWYYLTIAELLKPDLGDTFAWQEFDRIVHAVFDRYLKK